MLQCGPVQMQNIPISAAGLALLEMFKVFQCESIYCLGEKKAVAVLDSELFLKKEKRQWSQVFNKTEHFSADLPL